ncbi:cerebellin-2-like [Garra rufa]|uniref:cerebellin-2-like n=1 Tax=Garra rufa TaxID=137080 RepID=UPI003CCE9D4F
MKLKISIVLLLCVWATLAQYSGSFRKNWEMEILEEKLKALNDEVEKLSKRVAFSGSVSDSLGQQNFGPHAEATTLVYKHVFTNIGNAYDTNTGIFTAPVKGVYFFNFVVFNAYETATAVQLMKNGNLVLKASDNAPGTDTEDTTSNSVSLILEQGDKIHIELIETRRIYTDSGRRNTFSGHLLFAL